MRVLSIVFGFILSSSQVLVAGPKGTIVVPYYPPGTITIDGEFSDWPFDQYTDVAQQPLFPGARNSDSSPAIGDHLHLERDRVGFFNGSAITDLGGVTDFGAVHYFAHDDNFFYMLSIAIDDAVFADQDTTPFGSSGFLNDGYEIFIDAAGDSLDAADEDNFPNFDQRAPNLDDFQLTIGLNENFTPDGAELGVIGARQGIERAGIVELFLGEDDQKNGPGSLYRDIIDSPEIQPDIAARIYGELNDVGAPNPEIAEDPNTSFAGYAVEVKMPFGFIPEFVPSNVMGFDLFWPDFDNEGAPGAGGIVWMDWAQNTEVQSDGAGNGLFDTSNWGQLIFAPATTPGDLNGDQDTNLADLDFLISEIAGGSMDSALDLNGDNQVDTDDIGEWLAIGAEANGFAEPYLFGDSNLDGKVDAQDLNNMALNWQQSHATWMGGDLNGSGFVDAGDLNLLALNWDQQIAQAAAVPEPCQPLWILFGFGALWGYRSVHR